jgi:hypothetical protein
MVFKSELKSRKRILKKLGYCRRERECRVFIIAFLLQHFDILQFKSCIIRFEKASVALHISHPHFPSQRGTRCSNEGTRGVRGSSRRIPHPFLHPPNYCNARDALSSRITNTFVAVALRSMPATKCWCVSCFSMAYYRASPRRCVPLIFPSYFQYRFFPNETA